MQFLVIVQTTHDVSDHPPADLDRVLADEQAQGRALYGSGDLRQSWEIANDRPGVVCLYEAPTREQLDAWLGTYGMIQRGLAEVSVWALKPDSAYVKLP